MADAFTLLFVACVLIMIGLKGWLALRQIRHVAAHADTVPAQFAAQMPLDAHRKAAAYTIAKQRFGLIEMAAAAAVLIALTLLGGLQVIADALRGPVGSGLAFQVAVVAGVLLVMSLLDLPFEWVRQFRLEERFGFNRMTQRLFWIDQLKALGLAALLGLPVLAIVLWLMQQAGALWWLYAWGVWITFTLLLLVLYPTVIAPWFNRFEPLQDASLNERIGALLARTGFASRGVFVMDGSKRSSHGNAYFTGFGRAKRIVFFDTLMQKLLPAEIEAVLAHELGHFKLHHVRKSMAMSFALSLGLLALLGWLAGQTWFYEGLGVSPSQVAGNEGLALALFMLVVPVFTFPLAPLASGLSRRHEYEADAFAATQTQAEDLVQALVKLYQDNAATLTPDPLHSAFYDSHPPAALRVARLRAVAQDLAGAQPAAAAA
jgi:STE24 endopeptidase